MKLCKANRTFVAKSGPIKPIIVIVFPTSEMSGRKFFIVPFLLNLINSKEMAR